MTPYPRLTILSLVLAEPVRFSPQLLGRPNLLTAGVSGVAAAMVPGARETEGTLPVLSPATWCASGRGVPDSPRLFDGEFAR